MSVRPKRLQTVLERAERTGRLVTLTLAALSLSGAARALSLEAVPDGDLPANARLGAFVLSTNGKPLLEVTSAPFAAGRAALEFPKTALEPRLLTQLTPESVAWNGLVGQVTVQGTPKYAELRLYIYGDANGSGKWEGGEKLLETAPRLGRSSVVLLYLEGAANVAADKGFAVSLGAGYSALSIETGRTVKGTVLEKLEKLALGAL